MIIELDEKDRMMLLFYLQTTLHSYGDREIYRADAISFLERTIEKLKEDSDDN